MISTHLIATDESRSRVVGWCRSCDSLVFGYLVFASTNFGLDVSINIENYPQFIDLGRQALFIVVVQTDWWAFRPRGKRHREIRSFSMRGFVLARSILLPMESQNFSIEITLSYLVDTWAQTRFILRERNQR